jgi:hypothetical protein
VPGRAASQHLGDSATSAKQARAPITPDDRTLDDTAMPEFGEEKVRRAPRAVTRIRARAHLKVVRFVTA